MTFQQKKIDIMFLLFFTCLLMTRTASAVVETPGPFKIAGLYVSGSSNYHFRILSNNPNLWLCQNGPTNDSWAYINEADDGAKGKIAALMTAYALGKTVSLSTLGVVDGPHTYCQIIEFRISD